MEHCRRSVNVYCSVEVDLFSEVESYRGFNNIDFSLRKFIRVFQSDIECCFIYICMKCIELEYHGLTKIE